MVREGLARKRPHQGSNNGNRRDWQRAVVVPSTVEGILGRSERRRLVQYCWQEPAVIVWGNAYIGAIRLAAYPLEYPLQ